MASVRLFAAGATMVLWLPSAVAVAALFATPVKRWPRLLGVLAVCQFLTLWSQLGDPVFALGYTLGNQVEAIVCGIVGIKVLGRRKSSPRGVAQVVGLFGGAMLGGAAGALVAFPFHPAANQSELAWRFLGTVLGVLAGTPALLKLRQHFGFGDQRVRIFAYEPKPYFALTITALMVLGVAVLAAPVAGLMPLLLAATIFVVIRFGQMGGACAVLTFCAAGTLVSLRTGTPVVGWEVDPFSAGLALQLQMVLLLASALPIAAVLLSREQLQAMLREQNRQLRDSVTILNLAKSLAGIGRWRYDVRTGAQDWSPLMLQLHGLPPDMAPDPGNVRALLPDGGEELFAHFAAHRDDRNPYRIKYRVNPAHGASRMLEMNVTNEFDDAGERVALFAVAMDVTEQIDRENALRAAREQAISQAAELQILANTDPLTGLANRRATFDWLERLIAATRGLDEPLTLVMFDIDHFKRINDCFGHATGDDVIRKIARLARSVTRGDDLVGRIGGEEFVCLLPGMTPTRARSLAERLRLAVADSRGDDGLPRATISLGLAQLRVGDDAAGLLARADGALYEAKEGGRNQLRRAA
ncbi:MAG: diguanylate cyclase [Croceibacterium sp.]